MIGSYDAIIVGAGIVGAACSVECARADLKVLVIDRGPIGGGATACGMGHLVVMDDSEAQFALTAYSRSLWKQRAPSLPDDVEFDNCGTLWVAADDEEMQEVWRKHAYYSERGIAVEILDSAALHAAEPSLRAPMAGALRVPDDSVIYPPCAARHFISEARALGAEVRLNTSVRRLCDDGGVELSDGSRLHSRICVNATGADSPALSRGIPVRPRKGHLVITDRHPRFVGHQIIELGYLKSAHSVKSDSVAFNIQPRKTGQMLIGSSRQFESTDGRVEPAILGRMLRRSAEYMPTIGALSAIRVWTGQRAATPDKLPLIGPSLTSDRVWLATGHEGLGITTSLGTAALLVDRLVGRAPAIDPMPYDPVRFKVHENLDG